MKAEGIVKGECVGRDGIYPIHEMFDAERVRLVDGGCRGNANTLVVDTV